MARALVRAGNEVRVIGAYSSDYPAPAYEEDNGVRVWRFHGATDRTAKMLAGLSGRISLTRRSLRDRSNGNHGMQMPDYLQFTMQRSRVDGTRAGMHRGGGAEPCTSR